MSKILVSTITVFGIELIVNWPDIFGDFGVRKSDGNFRKIWSNFEFRKVTFWLYHSVSIRPSSVYSLIKLFHCTCIMDEITKAGQRYSGLLLS